MFAKVPTAQICDICCGLSGTVDVGLGLCDQCGCSEMLRCVGRRRKKQIVPLHLHTTASDEQASTERQAVTLTSSQASHRNRNKQDRIKTGLGRGGWRSLLNIWAR